MELQLVFDILSSGLGTTILSIIILLVVIIRYAPPHIIKWIKLLKFRKKKKSYVNKLKVISTVFNSMELIRNLKGVDRVLLLEITNGGDVPTLGNKLYAKAILAEVNEEILSRNTIINKYEKVMIDRQYIQMLIEIIEQGKVQLNVKDMGESLLKSFYEIEGIKYSEEYHIYTDLNSKSSFILSVSTTQDNQEFQTNTIRNIFNIELNSIRQNFRDYRE